MSPFLSDQVTYYTYNFIGRHNRVASLPSKYAAGFLKWPNRGNPGLKYISVSEITIVCFCWLLFPGPLVIHTSNLEYPWHHGRPVVSCVCFSSLMVLDKELWFWFAIISAPITRVLFHPFTFPINLFKVLPSPPTTPTFVHGEAHLIQSSRNEPWLKKQPKMVGNFVLVSCILDDIEGKKLV